jgi:hypothetical protein
MILVPMLHTDLELITASLFADASLTLGFTRCTRKNCPEPNHTLTTQDPMSPSQL